MICSVIGCIPVLSLILKCSVKVQPFARPYGRAPNVVLFPAVSYVSL